MPANPNTDTGATSVEVTGTGNAFTAASYNASTRKITFTKGTTFLTEHIKSIDGLSGGTLTSPLKITGGDQANVAKIILDQSNKGQITDTSTSTLFGFMSSSVLTIGGNGYILALRGSGARPTYKGADLALYSDTQKTVKFTNTSVAASAFVADNNYSNYGYCASIGLSGVTANDTADVYFSGEQVEQEIYASFCESYAGGVKIYAAEKPSEAVIIPLILIHK